MSIKYTFFLKTGKNVVLTDDDSDLNMEKIISELTSILKSPKICLFSTKTDCVLLKSNEVQGVMIDSKNINFKTSNSIEISNSSENDGIQIINNDNDDNSFEIDEYDPNIKLNEIYEEYDTDDIDNIEIDDIEHTE